MDQGVSAQNANGASAPAGIDARGAQRFTLLVRAAKLIADGREYLCVLRDASASGIKVRMFHKVPPAHRYELELASGERLGMGLVWEDAGHAGFRFDQEVDVHHIVEERHSAFPKRPIRLGVGQPVMLGSGGLSYVATLRNISQAGACISSDHRLMLHQRVRIDAEGLAPIFAKVCWRNMPLHGLVFERSYAMEELASALQVLNTGPASNAALAEPARKVGA